MTTRLTIQRQPTTLLLVMAIAMPLSFSTWMALLDNFAIHQANFTGHEIGILQSLREVPGFLSFAVVFILLLITEQRLGLFVVDHTRYRYSHYRLFSVCGWALHLHRDHVAWLSLL